MSYMSNLDIERDSPYTRVVKALTNTNNPIVVDEILQLWLDNIMLRRNLSKVLLVLEDEIGERATGLPEFLDAQAILEC